MNFKKQIWIKIQTLSVVLLLSNSAFAQFRSAISIVPEFQFGYSNISVRDNKTRPYTDEGGYIGQFNLGLNVPFTKNITIRGNLLYNKRNSNLGQGMLDSIDMSVKTIIHSVGGDVTLNYTKYYKRNQALYLGLGPFYNYAISGNYKIIGADATATAVYLNEKNYNKIFKGDNAYYSPKNSGLVLKAGYRNRKNLFFSVFYNLGIANILPSTATFRFLTFRTNDFGLGIGYFIKTD